MALFFILFYLNKESSFIRKELYNHILKGETTGAEPEGREDEFTIPFPIRGDSPVTSKQAAQHTVSIVCPFKYLV